MRSSLGIGLDLSRLKKDPWCQESNHPELSAPCARCAARARVLHNAGAQGPVRIMQRLPANVRSALLSDAAPAAQHKIRRWTMRALAMCGGQSVPPRADVAEVLLNDVRLRLAKQLDRTLDMTKHAEAVLGVSDDGRSSRHEQSGPKQKPKIIRAINQPVRLSPKVQMAYESQSQLEKKAALKNLADLETLHAGTYQLVQELLNNGAPTLRRYSPADATVVAATFESVRSRHAMSVELMADVVIALRRARSLRAGIGITPAGQFCGIDLMLIDAFLRERLGIQLLCDHYVALDKGKPNGGISVACDLFGIDRGRCCDGSQACVRCQLRRCAGRDRYVWHGGDGFFAIATL